MCQERSPVAGQAPAALAQPGGDVARGRERDVRVLQRRALPVVDAQAHDVRRPRQLPLRAPQQAGSNFILGIRVRL